MSDYNPVTYSIPENWEPAGTTYPKVTTYNGPTARPPVKPVAPTRTVTPGQAQTPGQSQFGTYGAEAQTSAGAVVANMLTGYGLQTLIPWAMQQLQSGSSADEITLNMYQQPQFKQAFAPIFERQAAGMPPLSVQDVINYRDTADQLRSQYGLDPNFFTQADADKLLTDDVSTPELEARFSQGYDDVAKAPPEVGQYFDKEFGTNSQQAMVQWFIDPAKAEPLLLQQAQSAVLGGNAARYGIDLAPSDAMTLAQAGQTEASAQTGFQDIDKLSALFQTDVGDTKTITKAQGLEGELLGNTQTLDLEQQKLGSRAAGTSGKVGVEENPQKGFQGLGASF